MLDIITEFCKKYHIVAFGLGGVGLAFFITFFLRRGNGEWIWTNNRRR